MARRFLLSAVVGTALLTVTASAVGDQLPVSASIPANGGVYWSAPGMTSVSTEFQTPYQVTPNLSWVYVEVTRANVLGPDGTLANDLRVGMGTLNRRESNPSLWYGSFSLNTGLTTGTYYFQFFNPWVAQYAYDPFSTCSRLVIGGSGFCDYRSNVFSFTVVDPPPAPAATEPSPVPTGVLPAASPLPRLSARQAQSAARTFTRRRYRAKQQRVRCWRVNKSRATFRCNVQWKHGKKLVRKSMTVSRVRAGVRVTHVRTIRRF